MVRMRWSRTARQAAGAAPRGVSPEGVPASAPSMTARVAREQSLRKENDGEH